MGHAADTSFHVCLDWRNLGARGVGEWGGGGQGGGGGDIPSALFRWLRIKGGGIGGKGGAAINPTCISDSIHRGPGIRGDK